MAITISNLYVKTFEANVIHLCQQQKARLRPYVTEKQKTTSSDDFPRMGASEFEDKAGPRTATPENDSEYSNRIAVPSTKHDGDSFEDEDAAQMIQDPGSNLVRRMAYAANRAIDDIIIAAALGNALDRAGAQNALPAGQKVGAVDQHFSFDLVTEVAQKFMEKDIDPSEPKVMVVSPAQARAMLHMVEATSRDYVLAQALSNNGFVERWLGFDWVCSTRLPVPVAGARSCLAFTRDALGLLVVKDVSTQIAKDPSKSFMTRVYAALTMGAVRIEDEKVVELDCLDAIDPALL